MMFQFHFFLKNSFGILFFLFFLFELNMIGLAFMLSAFICKSSSSTIVGFSKFIVGFVTQIVVGAGVPYKQSISKAFQTVWSFFPPNPFAQALNVLSDAVSTPEDHGVSWSKRGECTPNKEDCVITINDIYKWLVATFFLWFVLAIYFDSIIPNASGVRKSILYFLNPSYWMGKGGQKVKEGGICSCIISVLHQEHSSPDDEDVLEKENTVKQQLAEGVVDANVAVQIHGFSKTYPGAMNIDCCCKCKRSTPFNALKPLPEWSSYNSIMRWISLSISLVVIQTTNMQKSSQLHLFLDHNYQFVVSLNFSPILFIFHLCPIYFVFQYGNVVEIVIYFLMSVTHILFG